MATQRAKKSRSLGIDPVPPRQTTTSAQRPELGDRHYSAPSIAQQKASSANRLSQASKASERTNRSSKTSSRDEPQSRSGSNAVDSQSSDRRSRTSKSTKRGTEEDIPLFSFVVIGNEEVGKTTFIRNALDLHKHKTISPISSSKVSLGGKIYRVQLIELLLEDIECDEDDHVSWPKNVNNLTFPNIDGAFCLYDVADKNSVAGLKQILSSLSSSQISSSLISCKVDISDVDQEAALAFAEQAKKHFKDLIVDQSTIESPESAKRCLLRILKATLSEPETHNRETHKMATAELISETSNCREQDSRSSSESRRKSHPSGRMSPLKSKDSRDSSTDLPTHERRSDKSFVNKEQDVASRGALRVDTQKASQSARRDTDPQTPISTVEPVSRHTTPARRKGSIVPETPESYTGYTMLRPGTADTNEGNQQQSFLNMDDDSIHENVSDTGARQVDDLEKLSLQPTKSEGGVPFSDLVNRLLSLPTTRSDEKFVPSFLCLYRCFATPHGLLTEIVDRFVKIENDTEMVAFTKVAEQLRYLQILALWTADYPGDFAGSTTRDVALTFVKSIEKSKNFGPAAREINNNLQVYTIDEDEDWAYSDPSANRSRSATLANKRPSTEALTKIISKTTQEQDSDNGDSEDDATRTQSSLRHSGAPSSSSSLLKISAPSSQSAVHLFALEAARENARKLRCIPHSRISKLHWHLFMDTPVEELAREIIRIDWTLYSAIKPRDFVRQALCPAVQKPKPTTLDAIAMMTRNFNHLTFFVSGMILLRDKPKHRAKILEKFMDLAWKVRQQNNYQSLGAIVAALKGEEIIRLNQTHELIPQETLKQFWRLKILMDHQRSHSAYRMAWENSFNERIPFLPRIQEDLTKAALGNATMIGQNIKWTKFEVMGETIIGLQKSRETPYKFPEKTQKSQEIIRLLLETKVLDGPEDSDDPRFELYERSKQIEPLTATDGKKKFDWLRR